MPRLRILVADANSDIREAMRQVIQAIGADVHLMEARDGREAMQTVLASRPHLLLADIKLAHLDTLTLVRHIKQRVPETRTIVLLTDDNKEYRAAAVRAGACGVLPKQELGEDWIRVMIVLLLTGSETPCEMGNQQQNDT